MHEKILNSVLSDLYIYIIIPGSYQPIIAPWYKGTPAAETGILNNQEKFRFSILVYCGYPITTDRNGHMI